MFESRLQLLCEQFNVPLPDQFAMCGRLKTTAGLYKVDMQKFPKGRLTVSKKYLNQNGYEAAEKILLHEFVHHYLFHKYAHLPFRERWAKTGHTLEFKKMCASLGGTMNQRMAGERFAEAACTDFVKSAHKWKYICDCGEEITRTKRAYSARELSRYRCRSCKTPMHSNMKRSI